MTPEASLCWECGRGGDLHQHHVVPRSRGGTRTVPLCEDCHGKAHHRVRRMSTSRLTRDAMAHKRARGEYTGGRLPYGWSLAGDGVSLVPNEAERAIVAEGRRLRGAGLSLRAVGAELEALGLLPRSGGRWHAETVKAALGANVAEAATSPRPPQASQPRAGLRSRPG